MSDLTRLNSWSNNTQANVNNVGHSVITSVDSKHTLQAAKATYAVSTLVNGPAVRGNGIKHHNGPTSKGELLAQYLI